MNVINIEEGEYRNIVFVAVYREAPKGSQSMLSERPVCKAADTRKSLKPDKLAVLQWHHLRLVSNNKGLKRGEIHTILVLCSLLIERRNLTAMNRPVLGTVSLVVTVPSPSALDADKNAAGSPSSKDSFAAAF